ncbi:MAG: RDD family protein [Actinomycetes bacterium]
MSDANGFSPTGSQTYPPPEGRRAPDRPATVAPLPPAPVFASWGSRVGSCLVDALPIFFVLVLGSVIDGTSGPGPGVALGYVLGLAIYVWNAVVRQGRTGQSLGKSVLNTRLVNARTGQPIGAGMSFVRGLAHALDTWSLMIGYLWPLWDAKRQTFSDKVTASVVVRS